MASPGDGVTAVTWGAGSIDHTEGSRRVTYGEHPRLDGSVRYGGIYAHASGDDVSAETVDDGNDPSTTTVDAGNGTTSVTWGAGD